MISPNFLTFMYEKTLIVQKVPESLGTNNSRPMLEWGVLGVAKVVHMAKQLEIWQV